MQIIDRYRAANEDIRNAGRQWYPNALSLCEEIAADDVPVSTVARVMAALSPRTHWATNVRWARSIVDAFRRGDTEPPPISTVVFRNRAWLELNGTPALSGPKTSAFAAAILGDTEAVTIDSWILRSVGLKPNAKVTPKRVREITAAYAEAAAEAGETPRDLQAIVWVQLRGGGE